MMNEQKRVDELLDKQKMTTYVFFLLFAVLLSVAFFLSHSLNQANQKNEELISELGVQIEMNQATISSRDSLLRVIDSLERQYNKSPDSLSAAIRKVLQNQFEISYEVKIFYYQIDEDLRIIVSERLADTGAKLIKDEILTFKPSWFASLPTVFYYSEDSKEHAKQVAEILSRELDKKVTVDVGSGLGVPSDKKKISLRIHLM